MTRVPRHFMTVRILMVFFILAVTSCQLFQPTAQFFIINESQDKNTVDIKVTLGGETVFNGIIKYTNVRPDLQYTPRTTLTKGKYMITIIADGSKVNVQKPIVLDSDRFIFITYSYKEPVDSATLIKNLGFPFADKLKGQQPKIGVYITDKEPVNM